MWVILKAEFRYTWAGLAVGWAIGLLLSLFNLLSEEADLLHVMPAAAVTYLILVGILGSESDAEKRERILCLLPIPQAWVFWSRILYLAGYLLFTALIWVICLVLDPGLRSPDAAWSMLAMGSLTLFVITVFVLNYDLGFLGPKGRGYRWTLWLSVLSLLSAGAAFAYLAGWRVFADWALKIFQTPLGALFALSCWLLLVWLSAAVYRRRRSYLA